MNKSVLILWMLNKNLYCTSLNINVKIEADVEKLKETYFKPMFESIQLFKDKLQFCLRNKGTKVSFEVVGKEGKLVNALMGLIQLNIINLISL